MRKTTKRAIQGLALAAAVAFCGAASAALVTFTNDIAGGKADGFASVDSACLTFSGKTAGELSVGDYGTQSDGKALLLGDDTNGNILQMNFCGPQNALSLEFGNDDPSFTNPGDLALLKLFNGATQVGQVQVALNRDDLMNQTISYAGAAFDNATFAYTDPAGSPFTGGGPNAATGLIEIVDNIAFESRNGNVPEPATLALIGLGLFGLGAVRRPKR